MAGEPLQNKWNALLKEINFLQANEYWRNVETEQTASNKIQEFLKSLGKREGRYKKQSRNNVEEIKKTQKKRHGGMRTEDRP